MIIKDFKRTKDKNITIFFKLYFYISIFILIAFSFIFFNTGVWKNNKNDLLNRIYKNGINNYIYILNIGYSSIKSFFINLDDLNLNISYENYLEIENDRQNLIKNSTKDNSMRDENHIFKEVPVEMEFEGENTNGVIRLKGDRITHFEKDKSSFKIKVSNDDKVFGVKKFSLIKPRSRNYLHEWLYHEFAGEENLIKLKYEFINLNINGNSNGLYVFEENFDKDLVERNNRRNGPIFSLTEEYSKMASFSKFELFNKNFWKKPENLRLAEAAEKKLKEFYDGNLDAKDVFDLKKWFWLFAVADLTYTHHGLSPVNVKFFYNPLSGLVEPIPYDGHRILPNFHKNLKEFNHQTTFEISQKCLISVCTDGDEMSKFLERFFYDSEKKLINENYRIYRTAVAKISSSKFLNSFFNKNRKKEINKINSKIYGDYFLIDNTNYAKYGPGLYYFKYEDLFARSEFLKKKIKINLSKVNITENEKKIVIKNNNFENNVSLSPTSLICEITKKNNTINLNVNLNQKYFFSKSNSIILYKDKINSKIDKCLFVKFNDKNLEEEILKPIDYLSEKKYKFSKDTNFKKYFNKKDNVLVLKQDETYLYEDLYIPKNFLVRIKPGQKLILQNSAVVLSESPWISGEANKPKVFIGGTRKNFGGGIIIKTEKKQESKFINTTISFLYGPNDRYLDENENFKITSEYLNNNKFLNKRVSLLSEGKIRFSDFNYLGAINFYNSSVEIKFCDFSFINSEDALNIISSNFKIADTKFYENASDAIDIDFGKGKLKNIHLKTIGNDGIDFSGSIVDLNNINLIGIGDKSISVGENSLINIKNVNSEKSFIGIAVKDGSKTIVKNIDFKKVKIPFASYRKKKSYDYGKLIVQKPFKLEDFSIKYLKDKKSEIVLNNKKMKNYDDDYINIVYKKKLDLIDDKKL